MYIAVAGNIGSGKTTLVHLLAQHYGWKQQQEPVDENPYLEDYYRDLPRWSFNVEVYFLKQRFRDLLEICRCPQTVIQDRTIFEGVYVFAANNKAMGNMSDRDFNTYMALFRCMMSVVKLPELMIYLRSSVPHLVGNIQKRGRLYEQKIPLDYLENLNRLYEDFFAHRYHGNVLTIEADSMDFLHSARQFGEITDRIDAFLNGLFPLQDTPSSAIPR